MIGYKNLGITASIIVEKEGKILLVQRKNEPFKDMWALPGGFLDYGKENLAETAKRELEEETGLKVNLKDLELLLESSNPDRDPRGHIIDHIYIAKNCSGKEKAADDAKALEYFPLNNLPALAFDHGKAIEAYKLWRKK